MPILWNGYLQHQYLTAERRWVTKIICKPFKKSHEEQLGLVSSFELIDFGRLDGIENDIVDLMSTKEAVAFLGEDRYGPIADFVSKRIKKLKEYIVSKSG